MAPPPIKITLTLGTIALCALFMAHGVTSYTASQLIAIDSGLATANQAGQAQQPPGTEPPNVQAILLRNAFDPTTALEHTPDGSVAKASELSPPPRVFRKGKKAADRVVADATETELDSAITRVSETQRIVKRSFVNKLLGDPAALMRLARAVLHEENGQAAGVKLYGIHGASVLGRLGLENGDLLRSINGMSLVDANAALEAFAQLRGASNLKVALSRRGQAMSLGIRITD